MNAYFRLKNAYREWFETLEVQVAFTGSARQCRYEGGVPEWLTIDALNGNVRHVMKRLSREVFGRTRTGRKQRLPYYAVIEGDEKSYGQRLHCHLAIGGIPPGHSLDDVRQVLARLWQDSWWGYREVHSAALSAPDESARWAGYILKEFDPRATERWTTNLKTE